MLKFKITLHDDRPDAVLPWTVFNDVKAVNKTDARIFGETLAKTLNLYQVSVEVECVPDKKEKK